MFRNYGWVATCNDCGWTKTFRSLKKGTSALDNHFDTHPDEDLPVGGKVEMRKIFMTRGKH